MCSNHKERHESITNDFQKDITFSESELVVPGSIDVISAQCQLSHCPTCILGEDSVTHNSTRRKQESKGNITLIKGSLHFLTMRHLPTTIQNPRSFVIGEHVFCLGPLKIRWGHNTHVYQANKCC